MPVIRLIARIFIIVDDSQCELIIHEWLVTEDRTLSFSQSFFVYHYTYIFAVSILDTA